MSTSEAARLALYDRLGEVIGPENAETLMSSLPLHPTDQLAAKDDVDRLDRRIGEVVEGLRARPQSFRSSMRLSASR